MKSLNYQLTNILLKWGFLFILGLLCTPQLQAQEVLMSKSAKSKPSWVSDANRQTAYNEDYFYGMGEGNTLSDAKSIAIKEVIIGIFQKKGCKISMTEITKTMQKQKGESFEIDGEYYSVVTSKCSEINTEGYTTQGVYWEEWKREEKTFYRYYLWVSLPKPKLISKNTAMLWSIFPGGGQLYKREYGRTTLIWAGLAATGVGAFHFSNRAVHWRDVAAGFPSNMTLRNEYERYQRANTIAMIGSGVAAAGVYIWNLYDAKHHENNRIRTASSKFKLQPYYAANHGGIMLSYSLHPQK